MKKLTQTQLNLMAKLTHDLDVIKSYPDFDTFYDNCGRDGKHQWCLTCGYHCNSLYDTAEKVKAIDMGKYLKEKALWERAVNENVMFVIAKSSTLDALVKAGYIEPVRDIDHCGGVDYIKVLKEVRLEEAE